MIVHKLLLVAFILSEDNLRTAGLYEYVQEPNTTTFVERSHVNINRKVRL